MHLILLSLKKDEYYGHWNSSSFIIVGSEESVDFYKDLGFKVCRTINRFHDIVILMNGFGIGFELFIDPRHQRRTNARTSWTSFNFV